MKRKYIKPESVLTTCRLFNMVMASNQTEWHTGTDGQGDDEKIGGDQPDPNGDAKASTGLWDDVDDDEM